MSWLIDEKHNPSIMKWEMMMLIFHIPLCFIIFKYFNIQKSLTQLFGIFLYKIYIQKWKRCNILNTKIKKKIKIIISRSRVDCWEKSFKLLCRVCSNCCVKRKSGSDEFKSNQIDDVLDIVSIYKEVVDFSHAD